jgi:adenosylcobinamide-GDP ribazoletransferase
MTRLGDALRGIVRDLAVALAFYTRLPLPHPAAIAGADIARASWAAPVAGAVVGSLGALAYLLGDAVGLRPMLSATLAVATSIVVTGALHEDGLADTADGLGGTDREKTLAIMRDSRLGTFGALALLISLMLRVGAIASLGGPDEVAPVLIAAHAGARAALPAFMALVPPARVDGLSAAAGTPPVWSIVAAGMLGVVALCLLGALHGVIALILVSLAAAAIALLCIRRIGGQTGDVLGALEQVSEVAILLVAAARVG